MFNNMFQHTQQPKKTCKIELYFKQNLKITK